MKLRYEAFTSAGAAKNGTLEAMSLSAARDQLREEGLFVSKLEQEGGAVGSGGSSSLKRLAQVTRQLSVLVGTGTPVVEALATVERQVRDEHWRGVVTGVRKRVEEGTTLAEAMGHYPKEFDPVCRSLIAAGEASGTLGTMLERLSELTRRQQKTRAMLVGAMVYPVVLSSVSVVVLLLMIMFVLPRFTGLFDTLDAPLPPTTAALLAVSNVLRGYWWGIGPGIGASVFGVVMWLKTEGGRAAVDRLIVRAPIVGPMVRGFAVAKLARMIGTLLESRVQLLEAIELAKDAVSNREYRELMSRAHELVSKGEALSEALRHPLLIPDNVTEAVKNAERAGTTGPVLSSLADFIEEDNEVVVRSLSSVLEPLILIGLGVVVGFIALSLFLPLFDLAAAPGAGGPTP
ncbi:MAG: type II secretion system F family protein [Planctomycetota bacterium]